MRTEGQEGQVADLSLRPFLASDQGKRTTRRDRRDRMMQAIHMHPMSKMRYLRTQLIHIGGTLTYRAGRKANLSLRTPICPFRAGQRA